MSQSIEKSIFLADDDPDDCMLFHDALIQISSDTKLTMAKDGQHLMELLNEPAAPIPDLIFLDLNMPRKNGFECLDEIRRSDKLHGIPVVIFSTSTQEETIAKLYEKGADFYICKPGTFALLKKAIEKVLSINWHEFIHPSKENFVLQL